MSDGFGHSSFNYFNHSLIFVIHHMLTIHSLADNKRVSEALEKRREEGWEHRELGYQGRVIKKEG